MARILLVDDDRSQRELVRTHVARAGHEVKAVADAAQALALLHAREYDLLLTDVEMPYVDGLELARAIRSDNGLKDLKIVFLSALRDSATWREAMRLGATNYLLKPVRAEELLREIG